MPGPGGCLIWGGVPGLGVPGPRGSCSGGPGPGGCLVETPRQPLLQAVRILLECILVSVDKCSNYDFNCKSKCVKTKE